MSQLVAELALRYAPWLILLGVCCMFLSMLGVVGLMVTGVSLMAIGATATLASRPGVDPLLLVVQLAVYTGLFLLFAGAAWHASQPGLRTGVLSDLLLGGGVMLIHGPLLRHVARAA